MTVTLSEPVALEAGQRFAIRDGDQNVGVGVIAKTIK
ncbi:hypothetical protein AB0M39_37370 [Streptomyces sp. NPDC051907]